MPDGNPAAGHRATGTDSGNLPKRCTPVNIRRAARAARLHAFAGCRQRIGIARVGGGAAAPPAS